MSTYDKQQLINAFKDTLYLLLITGIFLTIIGVILGFALYFLQPSQEKENPLWKRVIYFSLGGVIDIARSIPFIILMIMMIPLTIILVGTMLGPKAALPSLIISASPFYARVVYNALNDIPKGQLEALEALGAKKITTIKYLILEALPSLIAGLTVALVTLVGFIAAAGAVGAGGLGDLARRKALALEYEVMNISVILLLAIVLIIQLTGDFITKKVDKR